TDLGETVDKADEEKDAHLLQPRVADPALEIRAAEYALAKATDGGEDAYAPRTLIADPQVRIVSVSDSWPRTMMVVTQIADNENVQLLLTLQQNDARSPYKLLLCGGPGGREPGHGGRGRHVRAQDHRRRFGSAHPGDRERRLHRGG